MNPRKAQKITQLFDITLPIIQGGMVYCSGAKLAAACSNAGALGLIGAGSMDLDLLRSQIRKAKKLTNKPIGINLPLLYSKVEDQITIALKEGIKIFFTSAGSPKKYTSYLKEKGCIVVHVTSTPTLAMKCETAGVDAIVVEGFEAGGHNSPDELTTMVVIPEVLKQVSIPVIAAGGVATGRGILAALSLGASGVQIGSRFAATKESSAHQAYKEYIVNMQATDTMLALKELVPVRLAKNEFYKKIKELEDHGASKEEFSALLGKGRARKGMLEGDLIEGELEIGQVSGLIHDIPSVAELVERLTEEYKEAYSQLPKTIG